MSPPLVTIAMPILNTGCFQPAALDSLLAQTFADWQSELWARGRWRWGRARQPRIHAAASGAVERPRVSGARLQGAEGWAGGRVAG